MDSGQSAPVPPWEVELAQQALAEAHARDAAAGVDAKAQELARRMALIENAELQAQHTSADNELWSRMWSRWRWSGINGSELLYALTRSMRHPEWFFVILAVLCLLIWLVMPAVKFWLTGLIGP